MAREHHAQLREKEPPVTTETDSKQDTLPVAQDGEEKMPARLCPYCHALSDFDRGSAVNAGGTPPKNSGEEISLDSCQNCDAYVYFRTQKGGGDPVTEQYPLVVDHADDKLPDGVKRAFNEALVCYGAQAPNGTALLCRRALQETMKLDNLAAPVFCDVVWQCREGPIGVIPADCAFQEIVVVEDDEQNIIRHFR